MMCGWSSSAASAPAALGGALCAGSCCGRDGVRLACAATAGESAHDARLGGGSGVSGGAGAASCAEHFDGVVGLWWVGLGDMGLCCMC